jgi:ankyrin repeat protein
MPLITSSLDDATLFTNQIFLTAIKINDIETIKHLINSGIEYQNLIRISYTTTLEIVKYFIENTDIDISHNNYNLIVTSVIMNLLDIVEYLVDIYMREYKSKIPHEINTRFFQELITVVGLEKPNNVNKNNLPLFKYLSKICSDNEFDIDYYMSVFHNFDDLNYIKYAIEIGYKMDFYRMPSLYNSSQEFTDYVLGLFYGGEDEHIASQLQSTNYQNVHIGKNVMFDSIDIVKAMDIAMARGNLHNINHYIENGYDLVRYRKHLLQNLGINGQLDVIQFLVTKLQYTTEDLEIIIEYSYPFGHYGNVKYLMDLIGGDYHNRGAFLYSAIKNNKLEWVKFFIENGVDINSGHPKYTYPLICAIWYGHLDIIQYFLDHAKTIIPDNILEIAIAYGETLCLTYCLARVVCVASLQN